MTYIPQAVVNDRLKAVLTYIPEEATYLRYWKGVLPTVDAPGEPIHPKDVAVGDIIDFNPVGWSKTKVMTTNFVTHHEDLPNYHRRGYYQFMTSDGYRSLAIDGRAVEGPRLFIFR